jgi:small subunit ribosomal protein S12
MGKGINAARSLKRAHKKQKHKKDRRKPHSMIGACQASGVVIDLREIECKQPNSGKRKCARIKLVKSGIDVTAFMPGDRALKKVDEHDTVIVEGIGGSKGKSMGDIPGVRFKIVKVEGISLDALVKGKVQKPVRR